ncbi:EamA family transporter [Aminipila butyrica]|uniref:EamA family transporter n=1 Tax=Aminipila butyrica TaxID=433296 RepID=A0A858BWN0_9FIRM|nr:EamA family transporter [Aminipila butyrica]QIB69310.1 EamA family transporter [Aminipila butyrica]
MKVRDLALATFVIILWGINFTVIKVGVHEIPPMLLVSLRFFFAAFPAVFLVKRPATSWKYVVAYGLTVGVGQFSCLFYAIHVGMPAGVASVVLQSQAFFTVLFAGIVFQERIKIGQAAGLLVSGVGLFLISGNLGGGQGAMIPVGAFLLTLVAAFFWGLSNIVVRQASKEAALQGNKLNMFHMVVWSSLIPPLPMLVASLILEKSEQVWHAMSNLNELAVFSVLYLALFATLIGYGIWSTLLSTYPAQKIAPLSLLVPVVGLITAQVFLSEKLSAIQWAGGGIIILGLLISNCAPLLGKRGSIERESFR